MTKHTPGPWRLGPSLGEVRDDDNNVLCDVYHDSDEQAEADTRLIAAAPDLLAACEALLNEARQYFPMVCGEAITQGEAAIAKARGKT